jgi:hypothetical protein
VRVETLHVDGGTDRHDEANGRFLNFGNAPKEAVVSSVRIGTGHLHITHIQALRIADQSMSDIRWTRENGTDFSDCLRDFPSGSFLQ